MERISYLTTDHRRQEIPKVIYREENGTLTEYVTDDFKKLPKEKLAQATTRSMDCIDCHNRPTHAFQLPDRALDKAMAEKRMSTDLPFLKKKALELLKVDYPDQKAAAAKIPVELAEYYRTTYPEIYRQKRAQVDTAAEVVKGIYLRNVFPEMKITWGTHPNNIGHEESVGCFRCHDGGHTAADGRTIKGDCDTCHALLAQDEKDPKILKDLGVN
jgi:Cytochrome c7 and related cytochrome c